jgi:hypothetical protein
MKLYLSLFLTIFFAGCTSLLNKSTIEVPKLSEKNRLLGALLPERICYDVQHYDINIDIDVDNKYLKGYVDFDAIAVNDFNLLQIDLAKSMKLNNVEYKGEKLSTSRKEDAVFIDFPNISAGQQFTFRVNY